MSDEPVEIELDLAAPDHVGVGTAGELVGPRRRQARRGERAGHQPLRPRWALVAAERQRCQVAALAHTPTIAARDRLGRQPLELERRDRARRRAARRRSRRGRPRFLGEQPPRRRRRSRPPSSRRRRRRHRDRRARGEARHDRTRLPETETTSAPYDESEGAPRSARAAAAGAVPKKATRRPRTSASGRGRKTTRTTGTPGRVSAVSWARDSRDRAPPRPSSRRRDLRAAPGRG